MREIGISVYPDFYGVEKIKEQLDRAKDLGYKRVFTSIQLGVLGFENSKVGITDTFRYLFDYCSQLGLILHVDINDEMLRVIGATPDNLKPIADLKIPVIRLDGGFTDLEAAIMTTNPYGIAIEENASMLQFPRKRIETIVNNGDVRNYYACHNFFPRNDTGLSFNDALEATKLFKSYGIKVGVFIGSLYSKNDLNASGMSVLTIEDQRYKPSHIQAMELMAYQEYDYIMFGDSDPRIDELEAVSRVAKNGLSSMSKEQYEKLSEEDIEAIKDLYCVEIPVWLDKSIDEATREKLTSIVFLSRADQPEYVVRATESRSVIKAAPNNTIEREIYSITIDNSNSNRYEGELQIMLKDMAPAPYANVIGMVKPYGRRLVELTKYSKVLFKLREE